MTHNDIVECVGGALEIARLLRNGLIVGVQANLSPNALYSLENSECNTHVNRTQGQRSSPSPPTCCVPPALYFSRVRFLSHADLASRADKRSTDSINKSDLLQSTVRPAHGQSSPCSTKCNSASIHWYVRLQ